VAPACRFFNINFALLCFSAYSGALLVVLRKFRSRQKFVLCVCIYTWMSACSGSVMHALACAVYIFIYLYMYVYSQTGLHTYIYSHIHGGSTHIDTYIHRLHMHGNHLRHTSACA
jgi:hypothetical protein